LNFDWLMKLIDTHCHVHFNAYKQDMDEVIRRSLEKGVFLITVGTQADTSRRGLEVAERYEGVWATVGLHPSHLCEQSFVDDEEVDPSQTQIIKTRCEVFDPKVYLPLAQHSKCVAIGECGLDYYHFPEGCDPEAEKERQRQTCRAHFELASKVGLPVVIHSRNAHKEQLGIIKEFLDQNQLQRRGVIHCFTGTLEEAQAYLDSGFLISVTGIVTFSPRKKDQLESGLSLLQEVVRQLPLESLMVETDAPYICPEPFRGQRNEPWQVITIAKKIAEIKGISFEEVAEVTNTNAKRLFGISF